MAISFDYGLNSAATEYDGENKYLRITDIDDDSREFNISDLTSPEINLFGLDEYRLSIGDILFARTGASVGKSYIYRSVDGKVYFAGFLIRVKIKDTFNPDFVFQNTLTSNYERFISITSMRSGQPGVNAQEYSNYEIMFPSLPEQEVISTFFSTLDQQITLHQRKLDKLKSVKQAYLSEIFPAEGERVPKRRFPGFTDAWELRKFDECFNFPVSTNSLSRALLNYDEGDIKSVHYGDILIKYPAILNIKNDKIPYITGGKLEKYKSSLLENGDLIFADAAEDETVGKAVEVNGLTEENLVAGLHTIVARPKDKKAEFFLGYYINSNTYHRQLLRLIQGSKVSSINKGNLQKTLVSFPKDFEEQQKIGAFFKKIDDTITLHQRKLDKLKSVKQAYLSEMFPAEGERVPKRRFPGFTDDWELWKLGEVGEIERESVNPKLSPNNIFEEYSMPSFDVDRRPAYVLGKDMLSSRLKIQRSSLLINKLNVRQQRIWLVETPSENAICSSEFMPFVSEMVNLEFLREFFLSNETTKKLEELSTGTSNSQNRVSPKDIINFKLAIPTLPEQEAIGTFFSTLDRHITLHQRKS